jgi:hypothetical protein
VLDSELRDRTGDAFTVHFAIRFELIDAFFQGSDSLA